MQTYQRESKPIQDVYAQVTQLFNTAPDLLEDFKQFLPESAAQAKQQAQAARQAAEEAAPVSNVRGEPGYSGAGNLAQSQTPNRDVKMPPLGQFNVKDTAKDSKKRRGGPGAPGALGAVPGPSTTLDAARMTDAQARAQGIQVGNINKVSEFVLFLFNMEWRRSIAVLFMNGPNRCVTPGIESYISSTYGIFLHGLILKRTYTLSCYTSLQINPHPTSYYTPFHIASCPCSSSDNLRPFFSLLWLSTLHSISTLLAR